MLSAKHLQHLPAVAVVLSVSAWVICAIAVGTSYWLVGTATRRPLQMSSTVSPGENVNDTELKDGVNGEGVTHSEDPTIVNGHFGLFLTCDDSNYQLDTAFTGKRWQCTSVMNFLHSMSDNIILHQWKSVIAFELVCTVAIFFASVIATIGWIKKMPLPTLLAGVTEAMADLFMMVGHAMFITAHGSIESSLFVGLGPEWQTSWTYGSSFTMAWLGFSLSAFAAILDITMFVCSDRYRENDLTAMPV
ncbi:germ cell-specific gene 1-like protein [Ptychodera flava]|uniref:germ cell-specific gene 1-like protein n=1 Tax=Ptychodera flava TaxID=63121 RepID=UPI003969CF63